MSRGFGSTFGVGTSDVIKANYSAVPSSQLSVSVWLYIRTDGGGFASPMGQDNSSNNKNWVLYTDGSATKMGFQQSWSSGNGNWDINVSTLQWFHLCVTYNGASSSNIPVMYLNGVSQSVTTVTLVSGSLSTTSQQAWIGNAITGNNTWDGMIAHAAFWNGIILSAGEALALASGVPPLLVRPDSLSFYLPLDGVNSPEPDLINGCSSSITGTKLGTSDPPVMPISRIRKKLDYETNNPVAIIACAIAAGQQNGFGALSISEVITSTIAARQQTSFAKLSIGEVIAAAIVATQQRNDATISVGETITAALKAYEKTGYGGLSISEVIAATIDALQQMNHMRYVPAVQAVGGFVALMDSSVNTLALADAAMYNAAVSDAANNTVTLSDAEA